MKPWMDQIEIDLIKSYLCPSFSMFEWGSGGSTIYFSKYVQIYNSVEHDQKWYQIIKENLTDNTNIDIRHIDKSNEYTNYINSIDNFINQKYNAILIDGRERVRCAIKARHYLTNNSVLFVHDFFKRPRYSPILEFYTIIDSIIDTQQTLAVFKLK